MAFEMLSAWLVDVVSIATGTGAVITVIGLVDKALNGRVRNIVQWWLGYDEHAERIDSVRESVSEVRASTADNGEKLDRLHDDHLHSMGLQVALAKNQQTVVDAVHELNGVDQPPEDLAIDEIEAFAIERGATWPGEFYRGSGVSDD